MYKPDVAQFATNIEQEIFTVHKELQNQIYVHTTYTSFTIHDPKKRIINKACVRDRLIHHAVVRVLQPLFEPTFIHHSYSSRKQKGTHKGIQEVETMLRKTSKNTSINCYALKCDIRKFFDSMPHAILFSVLKKKIYDERTLWLLQQIMYSYYSQYGKGYGIPIGNVSSQLFCNVYMNEFDQFIKHKLRIKHYARYTDDFIIIHTNKQYLVDIIKPIDDFLQTSLKLRLHPHKVQIRKYRQGIDFLGYILLPHHRRVRTKTMHRITKKLFQKKYDVTNGTITQEQYNQSMQSYLGVLKHANTCKQQEILTHVLW